MTNVRNSCIEAPLCSRQILRILWEQEGAEMGSPYPANDSISREEKAALWVESVMIQTSNLFFVFDICVCLFSAVSCNVCQGYDGGDFARVRSFGVVSCRHV